MIQRDPRQSLEASDPPAYEEPPSYEESSIIHQCELKGRPSVVPAAIFNAAWDAVSLKNALKSSNKKKIANILCKRSYKQRMQIATAYESSFDKSLAEDIKSKISGSAGNLFSSLLMSVPELYCHQLHKTKNEGMLETFAHALLSFSTNIFDGEVGDESILIEVMCTMSNIEIRKICATYQQMYGTRLEQRIRENKSGNFKKLLMILCTGSRNESQIVNSKAARTDAEALQKHFSKIITDEKPIIDVLCRKSFAQIKLIAREYKKLARSSLEQSVKRNFSDNLKDALLAIIRTSNNRSEYHARRLNKAINNYVTESRSLSRLIVTRSEIDLIDIKEEFNRIFRKPLKTCLKNEISGSYKHALLSLLDEN